MEPGASHSFDLVYKARRKGNYTTTARTLEALDRAPSNDVASATTTVSAK